MRHYTKAEWKSRKELCEQHHISRQTANRVIEVIRQYTGRIYPEKSILNYSDHLRINEDVFRDASEVRNLLNRGLKVREEYREIF